MHLFIVFLKSDYPSIREDEIVNLSRFADIWKVTEKGIDEVTRFKIAYSYGGNAVNWSIFNEETDRDRAFAAMVALVSGPHN